MRAAVASVAKKSGPATAAASTGTGCRCRQTRATAAATFRRNPSVTFHTGVPAAPARPAVIIVRNRLTVTTTTVVSRRRMRPGAPAGAFCSHDGASEGVDALVGSMAATVRGATDRPPSGDRTGRPGPRRTDRTMATDRSEDVVGRVVTVQWSRTSTAERYCHEPEPVRSPPVRVVRLALPASGAPQELVRAAQGAQRARCPGTAHRRHLGRDERWRLHQVVGCDPPPAAPRRPPRPAPPPRPPPPRPRPHPDRASAHLRATASSSSWSAAFVPAGPASAPTSWPNVPRASSCSWT